MRHLLRLQLAAFSPGGSCYFWDALFYAFSALFNNPAKANKGLFLVQGLQAQPT